MAVRHGYGKIAGADALVFAYDTGDTVNSYKGEPTENLADTEVYTIYGPATVTTQGTGHLQITTSSTNRGIYYEVGDRPGTWVMSFDYKAIQGNPGLGGHVQGGYGRWYVDGEEDLSTTDGLVNLRTKANDGEWHRVSRVVSNVTSSAFNGGIFIQITRKGADSYPAIAEIKNVQIENKTRPTQYAGPSGSRSATEGLKDLTGLGGIDLSNVSFDSNAQMTFDGTDDHIELGDLFDLADHFVDNQSFTIEAMVNIRNTDTSTSGGIFSNQKFQSQTDAPGFGLCLIPQGGAIKYCMNIVELVNSVQSSFEVKAPMAANIGNLEHVMYVYDNTANNIKAYRNGELEVTQTSVDFNWTLPTDTTRTRIGTSTQGGWGYYHEMDLPVVKCYNRALTAGEIKNNYSHYKNRFGI